MMVLWIEATSQDFNFPPEEAPHMMEAMLAITICYMDFQWWCRLVMAC